MAWSKEEKAAYHKAYQAANREKLSAYSKAWRIVNRERKAAADKAWYEENREKVAAYKKEWQTANSEQVSAQQRAWRENNPDKRNATNAKRRATKLQATPPWLTSDHLTEIQAIYLEASNHSTPHHVDHIIPLQGEDVCGLHVPWNLQVIPATENLSKGNRLTT